MPCDCLLFHCATTGGSGSAALALYSADGEPSVKGAIDCRRVVAFSTLLCCCCSSALIFACSGSRLRCSCCIDCIICCISCRSLSSAGAVSPDLCSCVSRPLLPTLRLCVPAPACTCAVAIGLSPVRLPSESLGSDIMNEDRNVSECDADLSSLL